MYPPEWAAALNRDPDADNLHKFGYQGAVATTEIAVWDLATAYNYISSATALGVSSTSTADTSAGTGARTIQIQGLDANYDEISETVTLNGQTEVSTTQSFLRVFRAKVLTAGSGGVNAGIIYIGTGTVTTGVNDNPHAAISIGQNQTLMAVYTVPNNRTALLFQLYMTADANQPGTARFVVREENGVFQVKDRWILDSTISGSNLVPLPAPVAYPAKSDIELRATATANTMAISASFSMIIVDDEGV
jgi:hypothetical protein